MDIKTVQDLIDCLENVADKSIPVYLDILNEQMWAPIKDISITTNSYNKNVVIINQLR